MKIAYYSHYFTPEIGAPSARIYDLANQWIMLGHSIEIVTCFPNHPTGKLYPGYQSRLHTTERMNGIVVHRHWTYITPNQGFVKKTIGHVSYLPSALMFSNRHVEAPDISIGTSPTFFAAIAAAALAKSRKLPFVMEIRDLWPAIFIELGILRNRTVIRCLERLEFALYRRATRVITVTESFRRALIERGVPYHKVHTIHNGADVEYWQPAEPPPELRSRLNVEGRFVVLYIGAHGISHALVRILESAKMLQNVTEIQFVFVGEGAEKELLVRQAKQDGLRNIQFLDSVERAAVRGFYSLADVCLVPLRDIPLFDAFVPSKMFEIMAMGRPMVASVRGEAATILRKSGAALVVDPEDSLSIAREIKFLFDHPDLARQMGRGGRNFVVDSYSRSALASSYLGLLEEAVGEYQAKPE